MKINKKQHEKNAKKANWDDIGEIIIDLEIERFVLKEHLTPKMIKEYDEIIAIYEARRFKDLESQREAGFSRTMLQESLSNIDIEYDIGDIDDGNL
jgi:hypothetical protein